MAKDGQNYIISYKCKKMTKSPKSFPRIGDIQISEAWTWNDSYIKMDGFIKSAKEQGATHIFWIPSGSTQGQLIPLL